MRRKRVLTTIFWSSAARECLRVASPPWERRLAIARSWPLVRPATHTHHTHTQHTHTHTLTLTLTHSQERAYTAFTPTLEGRLLSLMIVRRRGSVARKASCVLGLFCVAVAISSHEHCTSDLCEHRHTYSRTPVFEPPVCSLEPPVYPPQVYPLPQCVLYN